MSKTLSEHLAALLEQPDIEGLLAPRRTVEGVLPFFFSREELTATPPEALADVVETSSKWLLAKSVWRTVTHLAPEARLAVLCRACDARSLNNLARLGQLDLKRLVLLPLLCNDDRIRTCRCVHPEWPGEEAAFSAAADSASAHPLTPPADWADHFKRCIKCYGCRTACPVCVCPSCRLEDNDFLPVGVLPPAPLSYHLVRVMHVADVCSGCGACEDACPSGLPLLDLARAALGSLERRFAYQPGRDGSPSPLLTAHRAEGPAGAPAPAWPVCCSTPATGGPEA